MAQRNLVVNLDRKQALDPFKFGDGPELLQFGCRSMGLMTALAVLLAAQGSNDIDSRSHLVGSWAGDRIVIAGADATPDSAQGWCEDHDCAIYHCVLRPDRYTTGKEDIADISVQVIEVLWSEGPPDIRKGFSDRYEWSKDLPSGPNPRLRTSIPKARQY